MAQSIFISSDSYSEVRISLNNIILYIVLRWNGREGAWYLDLLDVNKSVIIEGVKLCFGSVVTEKLTNNPLGGNLYIINNDDSKDELGRNNFGQDKKYQLVYLTNTEELELF